MQKQKQQHQTRQPPFVSLDDDELKMVGAAPGTPASKRSGRYATISPAKTVRATTSASLSSSAGDDQQPQAQQPQQQRQRKRGIERGNEPQQNHEDAQAFMRSANATKACHRVCLILRFVVDAGLGHQGVCIVAVNLRGALTLPERGLRQAHTTRTSGNKGRPGELQRHWTRLQLRRQPAQVTIIASTNK